MVNPISASITSIASKFALRIALNSSGSGSGEKPKVPVIAPEQKRLVSSLVGFSLSRIVCKSSDCGSSALAKASMETMMNRNVPAVKYHNRPNRLLQGGRHMVKQ